MKAYLYAAVLALTAGMAQADGISGIFQTQANDDGHIGMVEFYDCGGKYCGRLIRSFDKGGNEIASNATGKNIVANMSDNGDNSFSGGTIWDPGADKTYKSKMTLKGDTLNVSGCVAIFCQKQTWRRAQ